MAAITWRQGLTLDKDPDEKLRFEFDWSDWLDAGEAVSTGTATATGVTLVTGSLSGSVYTAYVEGGTVGATGTVTCQVTTNSPQIAQRSIELNILER